ncbi:XRE family transcriptional regulator [Bacillus velezensis]|uniref:helix-turn-helix domain-containing protein n=1 Tax=Bacillus velezensis TaxID=492670 RepID=UPI00188A2D78|nr:helix-turn-helix transcriptional regulator [Bacillus velezensis]QOZ92930.1 XRE family transcriptional regulator [Bacillus velezensis]
MDKRTEIIEQLIADSGLSKKAFAEKIGLPPTTLRSMLSRGVGNASVDNVIKVCKGLGITTDQLEDLAGNDNDEIKTIAAHHDDEDWTEEELEEIRRFKEFVKSKRKNNQE